MKKICFLILLWTVLALSVHFRDWWLLNGLLTGVVLCVYFYECDRASEFEKKYNSLLDKHNKLPEDDFEAKEQDYKKRDRC